MPAMSMIAVVIEFPPNAKTNEPDMKLSNKAALAFEILVVCVWNCSWWQGGDK